MECAICQIRSAVGVCEESQVLICEECSIPCYGCGKRIASTKGHETKNGHIYCTPCFKDRAAKHAARRQEREGVAPVESAPRQGLIPEQEEPEEVADETMVLGRWQAPPPWKWSLWLGAVGILAMGLVIFFPSLRGIRLSPESFLPFAYGVAILPVIGLIWAAVGLLSKHYADDPDRNKVVYGAALAVVALVMLVFAVQPPPVPEEMRLLQESRQGQRSEQELQEYRQRMLNGERGTAAPSAENPR